MVKLMSRQEFEKITLSELIKLLKDNSKITIPKGTSELNIRDLAQNKLHGIIFLNNNEEIKDNKIIHKPIIPTPPKTGDN